MYISVVVSSRPLFFALISSTVNFKQNFIFLFDCVNPGTSTIFLHEICGQDSTRFLDSIYNCLHIIIINHVFILLGWWSMIYHLIYCLSIFGGNRLYIFQKYCHFRAKHLVKLQNWKIFFVYAFVNCKILAIAKLKFNKEIKGVDLGPVGGALNHNKNYSVFVLNDFWFMKLVVKCVKLK